MKLTIQIEIDTRNNPSLIEKVKHSIEHDYIDSWLEFAFGKALKMNFMRVNVTGIEVDENDNSWSENVLKSLPKKIKK